ncbi:unnamed protein product, partial [Ixodes hexagonus]
VPFGGAFQCRLCEKAFSGPAPYMQHLKSAKHLKKEEMESVTRRLHGNHLQSSPGGTAAINRMSAPLTATGFETYCELCSVSFTGIESSMAHFAGKKHKKTLERRQILWTLSHSSNLSASEADSCMSSASSTTGSCSMSSTTGLTSVSLSTSSAAMPSPTSMTSVPLAMSSATSMTPMSPTVVPCLPPANNTAAYASNGHRNASTDLPANILDGDLLTKPQITVISGDVSSPDSTVPANRPAPSAEPTYLNLNSAILSGRVCSSGVATSKPQKSDVDCKPESLPVQSDIISTASGDISNPSSHGTKMPNITFIDDGSGIQKVKVREAEGYGCKECGILLFSNMMFALEHYETDAHHSKRAISQSSSQGGNIAPGCQPLLLH